MLPTGRHFNTQGVEMTPKHDLVVGCLFFLLLPADLVISWMGLGEEDSQLGLGRVLVVISLDHQWTMLCLLTLWCSGDA